MCKRKARELQSLTFHDIEFDFDAEREADAKGGDTMVPSFHARGASDRDWSMRSPYMHGVQVGRNSPFVTPAGPTGDTSVAKSPFELSSPAAATPTHPDRKSSPDAVTSLFGSPRPFRGRSLDEFPSNLPLRGAPEEMPVFSLAEEPAGPRGSPSLSRQGRVIRHVRSLALTEQDFSAMSINPESLVSTIHERRSSPFDDMGDELVIFSSGQELKSASVLASSSNSSSSRSESKRASSDKLSNEEVQVMMMSRYPNLSRYSLSEIRERYAVHRLMNLSVEHVLPLIDLSSEAVQIRGSLSDLVFHARDLLVLVSSVA